MKTLNTQQDLFKIDRLISSVNFYTEEECSYQRMDWTQLGIGYKGLAIRIELRQRTGVEIAYVKIKILLQN